MSDDHGPGGDRDNGRGPGDDHGRTMSDAERRRAADARNEAREQRRGGLHVENDPLWREEFPYTSSGEDFIQRRDFTRYLLGASAAFAVSTIGAAAWASAQSFNVGEPQPIIESSKIEPGTEFLFAYPTERDPAMLIRLPDGELRAFSQKCTHLGCVVYYQPENERIFCPCHHGVFEPSTGDATAGPPERPLGKIDIEIRDGIVWAKGMKA